MTLMCELGLILQGEIRCKSLLGVQIAENFAWKLSSAALPQCHGQSVLITEKCG